MKNIDYRIYNGSFTTIIITSRAGKVKYLKRGETYEGTILAVNFLNNRVQMKIEAWDEKKRIRRKRT